MQQAAPYEATPCKVAKHRGWVTGQPGAQTSLVMDAPWSAYIWVAPLWYACCLTELHMWFAILRSPCVQCLELASEQLSAQRLHTR